MSKRRYGKNFSREILLKKFKIGLLLILSGLLQACGSDDRQDTLKVSGSIGECPTDFLIAKAVLFEAVTICATKNVASDKVQHAAAVTAQWLDNDQDGVADEPRLIKALVERRPVLLMSQAGFGWRQMDQIEKMLNDRDGQDLTGDETAPDQGRDASQEEIHHLIVTAGWKHFLPKVFSDDLFVESLLSKAWQSAEKKSLYEYGDPTCDPTCKIVEFDEVHKVL